MSVRIFSVIVFHREPIRGHVDLELRELAVGLLELDFKFDFTVLLLAFGRHDRSTGRIRRHRSYHRTRKVARPHVRLIFIVVCTIQAGTHHEERKDANQGYCSAYTRGADYHFLCITRAHNRLGQSGDHQVAWLRVS